MSDQVLGKYTGGFGLSLTIAIILNALLVISKESNAPLMKWMKGVSPHHWITHGFLILAVFLILGVAFANIKFEGKWWFDGKKLLRAIIAATVLSGVLIVGFFLMDMMK